LDICKCCGISGFRVLIRRKSSFRGMVSTLDLFRPQRWRRWRMRRVETQRRWILRDDCSFCHIRLIHSSSVPCARAGTSVNYPYTHRLRLLVFLRSLWNPNRPTLSLWANPPDMSSVCGAPCRIIESRFQPQNIRLTLRTSPYSSGRLTEECTGQSKKNVASLMFFASSLSRFSRV
jgi:hypothetical protein